MPAMFYLILSFYKHSYLQMPATKENKIAYILFLVLEYHKYICDWIKKPNCKYQ